MPCSHPLRGRDLATAPCPKGPVLPGAVTLMPPRPQASPPLPRDHILLPPLQTAPRPDPAGQHSPWLR